MMSKWQQLSVFVGLATLAVVVMVASGEEKQLSEGGRDLLRVAATKSLGYHRQDRKKNQLLKVPEASKEVEEELGGTRQKENPKKKRKKKRSKKRRRRKKLKAKEGENNWGRLPPYIRRVALMVARPPKRPPSKVKRTQKAECGHSYDVWRKSKYRIRLSHREPCTVIFRAFKGASLKLSCKKVSVGTCDSAEYLISDGGHLNHRYCGGVPYTEVKLAKTNELLMSYKPFLDSRVHEVLPPDVNCIVKGAKGTGYVAKGNQICPLSCGKTTAAAEAERPGFNASIGFGEETTARFDTASPPQEHNFTSDNTSPNALHNASFSSSASSAFLNYTSTVSSASTAAESMALASTAMASTALASTALASTATLFHNTTTDTETASNISTPLSSSEGRGHEYIRIQGGKPADIGEWPFIVSVQVIVGGSLLPCSGSILTSTFILTAGHCVYDVKKKRDRIKVVAYEYNVQIKDETPRQSILVKKIILHPQYDSKTQTADIALLKLKKALVFGEGVGPICIAPEGNYVGSPVVILGWGSLKYNGRDPDVLQEATQFVVDVNECAKNYSSLPPQDQEYPITRDHLCAAAPGIDSCEGDSGGPVLVQIGTSWYQLGIISFGFKCAVPGFPGVNTLVPSYAQWIFARIKDSTCD
ncbi:serine proteinase stubble-like [Macrobrachium nipponense]|uniref:serine proteinase stubble-like n=1 Tax=Macrobrachium nipponense TaxID=159736 RepID=UPI0030C8CF78